MKAIFYEQDGGWLHRCYFAGVDGNGVPQWVIINQGEPSTTLEGFANEVLCVGEVQFLTLCLEGEQPSSLTIAKLLGAATKNWVVDVGAHMRSRLDELISLGVTWKRDALKVTIDIFKHNNQFKVLIYHDYSWLEDIVRSDLLDSLDDVAWWIRNYFYVLESQAGITCHKKLQTPNEILSQMKRSQKELFDEIIAN